MEPTVNLQTLIEVDGKSYYQLRYPRRFPRPRRPLNAEEQEGARALAYLKKYKPEIIEEEIANLRKREQPTPLAPPDIRKKLQAEYGKLAKPSRVAFTPATDISQPTCVTRYEDRMFKSLANRPSDRGDFFINNPVTRLRDEALKAFVIKRYRETPTESDKLPGGCPEDLGHSRENAFADSSVPTTSDEMLGASALKCHHEDLVEAIENK